MNNPPDRPAVFIDKDGTLIEDVPYNADPALLRFQPGALAALAALQRAGFALVIASNQSGIALGKFTALQFDVLRQVPSLAHARVVKPDCLLLPVRAPQNNDVTRLAGTSCANSGTA